MSIFDQVKALGGVGRRGGTRKLAEARAAASGKSVAAEMRAVQRAVKSGKPPARQSAEVAKASRDRAAAQRVRAATSVNVGTVEVEYPTADGGRGEGSRNLGSYPVTGRLSGRMEAIALMYENGDEEGAEELLSEALLDEYGELGGTLRISDYGDGIDFQ